MDARDMIATGIKSGDLDLLVRALQAIAADSAQKKEL